MAEWTRKKLTTLHEPGAGASMLTGGRAGPALCWTVLALLGLWPFLGSLQLWPMAPDSALWIARSAWWQPDWPRWVFATHHFGVGYRPLAALTYTLNSLLAGSDPLMYRLTDLALHLAAAAGVFQLARALNADRPGLASAATALYLAHPATEEVVPYIARRSYSLCNALAFLGLLTLIRCVAGSRGPRSLLSWIAGASFAAALLSNEVAIVPFLVAPWLALAVARPASRWTVARSFAPSIALVCLALLARFLVIGGVGGYEPPEGPVQRARSVLAAFALSTTGVDELDLGALGITAAAAFFLYYCCRALSPARASWRSLALWLGIYALVCASQGVWFERQAYAAIAPIALLWSCVFGSLLEPGRTRPLARAAHLAVQLLAVAPILIASPLVRGPDPARLETWRARQALFEDAVEKLESCAEPAICRFVLPLSKERSADDSLKGRSALAEVSRFDRQPVDWLGVLMRHSDLVLEEYLYFDAPREDGSSPRFEMLGDGPVIAMPLGTTCFGRQRGGFVRLDERTSASVPLDDPPWPPGRWRYVYLAGARSGELIDLGPP